MGLTFHVLKKKSQELRESSESAAVFFINLSRELSNFFLLIPLIELFSVVSKLFRTIEDILYSSKQSI